MPSGIYSNINCYVDADKKFNSTKIQDEIKTYFIETIMKSDVLKGLLLFHKLGSGKTCTSILIADELITRNLINHVFIFSSGSLRKNWITEYCDTCGKSRDVLKNNFTFITYNFNVKNHLPEMNNSLIIIDEVHNLINGVKNESSNPMKIYDTISSSNSKILILSGTPIYSNIFEFSLMGYLLKPSAFPDPRVNKRIDRDWWEHTRKNVAKLQRDLEGIVSFYESNENFPDVRHQPIIKAIMSKKQEENYWNKSIQESSFKHPPSQNLLLTLPEKFKFLHKMYVMAQKNVITRASSNFYYPDGITDIVGEVESTIYNKKFLSDNVVAKGGWVSREALQNSLLLTCSMKFVALFVNLDFNIKEKHVIFTFLKEKSGALLIKSLLSLCGIECEIFTGDLTDSQRHNILKRFNAEDNIRGENIKVLIITEAGSEGISVKDVKHIHILETPNKVVKINQAIGRITRMNSHSRLPENERYVNVWRYWSVSSDKKSSSSEKTIDEILYEKNIEEEEEINTFLEILKSVSITK